MRKKLSGLALLAGLSLPGCDTKGAVVLNERKYDGEITIRVIQDVRFGEIDDYRVEVVTKDGERLLYISNDKEFSKLELLDGKGRVYTLEDRGYRRNKAE